MGYFVVIIENNIPSLYGPYWELVVLRNDLAAFLNCEELRELSPNETYFGKGWSATLLEHNYLNDRFPRSCGQSPSSTKGTN